MTLLIRAIVLAFSLFFGVYGKGWAVDHSEALFQKANKIYQAFLQSKNSEVSEQQKLQLIKDFKYIQNNFPTHPLAPLSLFQIGNLYRQLFHATHKHAYLNRSLQTFRHLIKIYPNTKLVDDSQFLIGRIFEEDKNELPLALLEYSKVLQYGDDQAKLALQKITQLQKQQLPTPDLFPFSSVKPQSSQKRQGGISIDHSRSLPKAKILSVQYWATENWMKIVINSSRPIPFLYGDLPPSPPPSSHQFHIDLLDSYSFVPVVANLIEENRFVQDVVLKAVNPRIARLTFASNTPVFWKVFNYEYSNQNTITLEIFPQISPILPVAITDQSVPQPIDASSFVKRPIRHIIIDPGHGGFDPGAVGFGIYEKDIVLSIGQKLKNMIEQQTSLKAFLTRDTDRFVSLEERSAFAKQHNGDLFISLHVNAHPVKQAHGIESYYLNTTDNQATHQLVIRENQMRAQGLQNFNNILRDLLNLSDSSQSETLTKSIHNYLLKNIGKRFSTVRNLGVKEAPFLILLRAGMPATLLELSFITNPEENHRLQDIQYHKIVAEGIFQGIQNYILQQRQG